MISCRWTLGNYKAEGKMGTRRASALQCIQWMESVFFCGNVRNCNMQPSIHSFVNFISLWVSSCFTARQQKTGCLCQVRIALRTEVCVFTKITAIRSFGHGLHTDCSAQVDSAFHPPRDGKWDQPYGWVIIPMAMGECSAYCSIQADSKVKFAA